MRKPEWPYQNIVSIAARRLLHEGFLGRIIHFDIQIHAYGQIVSYYIVSGCYVRLFGSTGLRWDAARLRRSEWRWSR